MAPLGSLPAMTNRLYRLFPLVLILALGVAACGGSDAESTTTAAGDAGTESVIGGGSAACDQATFATWVEEYGKSQGTTATLADGAFECADGWAVLNPSVGDGEEAFDETVVVQAEGPAWALMDRAKVCGADAASSEVPESLFQAACETN